LDLCRLVSATGKLIADAQHAALAIAEGCTWVTPATVTSPDSRRTVCLGTISSYNRRHPNCGQASTPADERVDREITPAGRLLLPAEDPFLFRRGALQVSNGKKPMGQLTRVAGTLLDEAKKHFQSPT
jgi:hypothetical protein